MSLPKPSSKATILITGASAGIGTEFARQLAVRGHNLTLVARRKERLDKIAKELRAAHGVTVVTRKCDLSVQAQRARLIKTLNEGESHLSAVINNAGFGSFGRFSELSLDSEQEMIKLNVLALHELTGAFLPGMIERGEGSILNVASVASFQPLPTNATYSATKAFVLSFTESLSGELGGTGVSVTALCPGPVATEFGEVAGAGEMESNLPGFVMQKPADVARAGINGMLKGRRTVFSGVAPMILGQAGRFAPRTALVPVMGKIALRVMDRR